MTIAAAGLILAFLVSTVYGAGFHVLVGGRLVLVPIYLLCLDRFCCGPFCGGCLGLDNIASGDRAIVFW